MSKNSQILSRLTRSLVGDSPLVPKIVQEGRKVIGKNEGAHSLATWPIVAALRKLKGKDKVNSAIYDKYLRKVNNLDDRAGAALAQHGPSKRLFTHKEIVPTKRKIKGLSGHAEYEGYKASAPVRKAMGVVTPLAAGMYLSDKLSGSSHKEEKMNKQAQDLMKQAADKIEALERREQATKIAYLMVEKGKCEPFGTYEELEEKLASLLQKDLKVVETALEMDADLTNFGKVASDNNPSAGPGLDQATGRFYARLSS